ncbi:acyltransferase domain-containing protein [Streptomyces mesophilus]|uniref:acyltransferase domain-containing protein n=1 Tax=Streptomyces mesophilus TaxID=1775132 RepID=UPI003317B058
MTPMTPDDWFDTLCSARADARIPDPKPLSEAEIATALDVFAIPEPDRIPLAATLPDPRRTPHLWEALLHCRRTLFTTDGAVQWPNAPEELGEAGRYFYAHLCFLSLSHALSLRQARAIPDEVTRATFADLGAKLTTYRLAHGTGGFDRQTWITRHLCGTLHRLGRLQFELRTYDSPSWGAQGAPADGPGEDEPVLDVHIADDGPLTPTACDASFAAARPFLARHHPEHPAAFATCHSWLLDPALGNHLKPGANIVAFQRRFTLHGDSPVCDEDVLEFVFHTRPGTTSTAGLPRDNTLQRVLLDQLDRGGHWHLRHGWLRLP